MRRTLVLISFAAFPCLFCENSGSGDDPTLTKRALVFPTPGPNNAPTKVQMIIGIGLPMEVDVSLIIGYVMKFNYALPSNASYFTNPYVRYDRSVEFPDDPLTDNEGHVTSRWELYGVLERALPSGKACLLRALCEAASVPFNGGLASELLHAFLTPSTTTESFRTEFDKEYRAAEEAGKRGDGSCDRLFTECTENYLEYFTDVH